MKASSKAPRCPWWRDALLAVALALPCYLVSGVTSTAIAQTGSDVIRRELSSPVTKAQEFLKEKRFKESLAALGETDSVHDKSPYETLIIEQMRAAASVGLEDAAQAEASYQLVIATGRLSTADRQAVEGNLAILFFRQKNYAKASSWGQQYLGDGGTNPQIHSLVINSLYLSNDFAGTSRELTMQLRATEAAGAVPTEDQYKLLASAQLKLNDEAGYVATVEKLVERYPTQDYWADLLSRVAGQKSFSERLLIDVYRLQRAVGALTEPADIMEFAKQSLEAGFPTEAAQVLQEGFKSGTLGTVPGGVKQQQLLAQATKAAAADAKSIDAPPADAKQGSALLNNGFDLVLNGRFDAGLGLMERGVGKGDLRFPDDARLRLGIAYAMAHQTANAVRALQGVGGGDGAAELARLWLIYVKRAP